MSDYLTGVVAKALDLEPTVRPVVPSMFEAKAGLGLVEADIATEATPVHAARREAAIAAADDSRAEVSPTNVLSDAAREFRVEHETVREILAETAEQSSIIRQEIRPDVIEQTTNVVTERLTRELREAELREIVVEAPTPPGAPVKLPVSNTEDAAAITPRVAPSPDSASPPGRADPAERRARAQRDEGPPNDEAAVRVTIGRVEVRAVFPPAVPIAQPKSKTAPVMPLEEYLKQRNRRER